jgi:hypothetical protein
MNSIAPQRTRRGRRGSDERSEDVEYFTYWLLDTGDRDDGGLRKLEVAILGGATIFNGAAILNHARSVID